MLAAVTTKTLTAIVHQIVDRFHPQQVILFGSYAYGVPTTDSDVDLLVVMEAEGKPLHAAARIAASIDHPFPIDILVMEPTALQDALERKAVFATEVLTKGVALYEARNRRVDRASGG